MQNVRFNSLTFFCKFLSFFRKKITFEAIYFSPVTIVMENIMLLLLQFCWSNSKKLENEKKVDHIQKRDWKDDRAYGTSINHVSKKTQFNQIVKNLWSIWSDATRYIAKLHFWFVTVTITIIKAIITTSNANFFYVFGQIKNFATKIVEKVFITITWLARKFHRPQKTTFFSDFVTILLRSMCDTAYHHHSLTSFVHDHLSMYKLQRRMRMRFLFGVKEKLCVCFFRMKIHWVTQSVMSKTWFHEMKKRLLLIFLSKKSLSSLVCCERHEREREKMGTKFTL